MCAINPKHQKHFTLSVYTSINMTEEMFTKMVMDAIVADEQRLNNVYPLLRFHINEKEEGEDKL